MNARHNDVVKVKKCCVGQCDKMYCRSDYLRDHLSRVHKMTRTEATACVHKLPFTKIPRTDFVKNRPNVKGTTQERVDNVKNSEQLNFDEFGKDIDLDVDVDLLNDIDVEDFGDIDDIAYLNEVLNTPEAPQDTGNEEPIPGPSHQPTDEKEYPYFSDISDASDYSDIEDIDSKSGDESSFFNSLPDRETVETISINLVTHKIHYMNGTVSERREHNFSVSPNFDINSFDLVDFCSRH